MGEMYILLLAISMLLAGHYSKVLRWEQFLVIYEEPNRNLLLRALSIGFMFNLFLPFRLGDLIRAYIAGSKLKNGFLFAIATIIVERFLDVVVVGILFATFLLLGFNTGKIVESTVFYIVFAGILLPVSILLVKFSRVPKMMMKNVSSIFNKNIELTLLLFSWSIISSFKDMYLQLNRRNLFLNTVCMWAFYMVSYYCFALYLQKIGGNYNVIDVFTLLFSYSNLDGATIGNAYKNIDFYTHLPILLLIYIGSPLLIMMLLSLLPKKIKAMAGNDTNTSSEKYLNLLPYINDKEKLAFLEAYFSGKSRDYFMTYLSINRDINIIQDFSAGSNATTILCADKEGTFFRKYAFGDAGKKLNEQAIWIKEHMENIFLPKIVNEKAGENYYCYDMEQNKLAIGFFNFIHSVNADKSWQILKNLLEDLHHNLHSLNIRKSDAASIEKYIDNKIIYNLNKIKASKWINRLLEYSYLYVNGKQYKNVKELEGILSKEHLIKIFQKDIYAELHGDLTIENIIYAEEMPKQYYLIDPNHGNIHNSPNLDYAKLLQSLHSGYEFLMRTKDFEVKNNQINFLHTRTVAYDRVYEKYKKYLLETFSIQEVRSIFYHELVHYLRLLPYKLEKDGEKSVIFFAAFIILLNEINDKEKEWLQYENETGDF